MTILLSKTATNSTTASSTSSSPLLEDYYTPPNNNDNYNDDDEETTTTTDDSNYDDDDTLSLSTAATSDLNKLTTTPLDDDDDDETQSSSSTTTGHGTPLDKLLAEEILHEYNDGDIQTLNALVNKLYEADVARRKKEEAKLREREEELVKQELLRRNAAVESSVGRGENEEEEDYDEEEEESLNSCEEQRRIINQEAKTSLLLTRLNADLPSEMPIHPPSFSPLHNNNNHNNNNQRQLSISSVDSPLHGPSIEIVPTSQLQTILPKWNQSWNEEREEWKMLMEESRKIKEEESERRRVLRRSNTDLAGSGSGVCFKRGAKGGERDTTTTTTVRRNRSAPNNYHSTTNSPRRSISSTYQNKYGKPKLITTSPNPIVTKSSKKIHRRHARYALTAGMMLGVRESVGGANGVECELEAKIWQEAEMNSDGYIMESKRRVLLDMQKRVEAEQAKDKQRIEVVLGPLKVTTIDTPHNELQEEEENEQEDSSSYHDTYLTTQCNRISKYKFSPSTFYLGSNTSEPLPHKYKFKVYAPVVFQRIRTLFGVEKQTFLHSICGKFNLYEFASNAKSGQFFFYSHDGRYMIKTLTYTEQKFLRLILPAYYRHLTKHPHTFLTHFYGLYRVCMPNADNTRLHFVVMRSVFHTEKKIDRVWDLKGSTSGRKSGVGESVLKDLDILVEGKKLRFREESERVGFLRQLEVDAAFLASMGIMDYSLLLGLHSGCEDECCGGRKSDNDDVEQQQQQQVTPTMTSERKRLDTVGTPEPPMTNTPHRRNVLKRAAINGSSSPPKPPPHPKGGGKASPPTKASPSSPSTLSALSKTISSMSDLGIQGGTPLRPETYYCGIIDILQYYNARKMGETVMKKAAGGNADSISCVDPETYGKRFVKFIGDLVE